MTSLDYIDLSTNDEVDSDSKGIEELDDVDYPVSPSSLALVSIGLSFITMQYGAKHKIDNSKKHLKPKKEDNGWESLWSDDINSSNIQYPLRNMLESRFHKEYRCLKHRSHFCENSNKVTCLGQHFHMRRGHYKINNNWRFMLGNSHNNNVTDLLIEVSCCYCNLNRTFLTMPVYEFYKHMQERHPMVQPFNDYLKYFKYCFLCNVSTKNVHESIIHRQMCTNAVMHNPNIIGTKYFNNCFKKLRNRYKLALWSCKNKGPEEFKKKVDCVIKNDNHSSLYKSYLKYALKNESQTPKQPPVTIQTPQTAKQQPQSAVSTVRIRPCVQALINSSDTNTVITSMKSRYLNLISQNISDGIIPAGAKDNGGPFIQIFPRVPPNKSPAPLSQSCVPLLIPNQTPDNNNSNINYEKSEILKKRRKNKESNANTIDVLVCEICNGMVKSSYAMYNHIKQVHSSIDLVDKMCPICSKKFYSKQGYQKHISGLFGECNLYRKCQVCHKSIGVNQIYHHIVNFHKDRLAKIMSAKSCLICRLSCTDLRKHLFINHNIISTNWNGFNDVNNDDMELRPINNIFNCHCCSFSYLSEADLRNHMILDNHPYRCELGCDFKSYKFHELCYHKAVVHQINCPNDPPKENIKCELCKAAFNQTSDKIWHFLSDHDTKCAVVLEEP